MPQVLLLDPWCLVPYYMISLYGSLRDQGVPVRLGSITYDLDPGCFERNGIGDRLGLLDVVGRRRIGNSLLRRGLKMVEGFVNQALIALYLWRRRPDVIHLHQPRMLHEGIPLEQWLMRWAGRLGVKTVHTVHNMLPHDTGARHRQIYQCFYRGMDALICHSEDARAQLVRDFGLDARRIHVIPHGPLFEERRMEPESAKAELGIEAERPVVLCQGIIRPYKGIPFLLESWERVHRERPDALLVVAGTGEADQLDELRGEVARRGFGESVRLDFRFLPVAEMLLWYRAADVLVYPYRHITTSGALMTGVAQEKPMVATRLPYFERLLTDERNALLVDYGNACQLADALLRLLGDELLRARLRDAAAELHRAMGGWEGIGELTLNCYQETREERAITRL